MHTWLKSIPNLKLLSKFCFLCAQIALICFLYRETFNEKLKQNDFAIIFYFLFGKLNPEKTKNNFRSVYPLRDSKQEAEFRQISMNMLKEINSKVFSFMNLLIMSLF